MTNRLKFQRNGDIVLETTGDGFVNTTAAKDLTYQVELKYADGWRVHGIYEPGRCFQAISDYRALRQNWNTRVVALNEFGNVVIPTGWLTRDNW